MDENRLVERIECMKIPKRFTKITKIVVSLREKVLQFSYTTSTNYTVRTKIIQNSVKIERTTYFMFHAR